MAAEGEFPKVDGDILYASDVNHLNSKILQIYTGTGFNSSDSSAGTDTQDHELNAVAAANTFDSNYVIITITGTHTMNTAGLANEIRTKLKAQIKETGGAYADILAYKTIVQWAGTDVTLHTNSYKIIGTLTAGQKTNGFQIKVFSQSATGNASQAASFANIQTIMELA